MEPNGAARQLLLHRCVFPRVLVNQRGRTQKRVPDSSPDPEDARSALETDMFEYAVNTRRLIILTAVWPALDQVNRDHNIRMRDLAPLVVNNPFVPAGRESIFARGLYAGLTGDFLVASHLLVPQLEHAVRVLLESHGAIVSGIEDDGSQPERGLNTTLVRPEALEFFGEDLIFDLRGLLVEKAGSNLRHDIAHGLLDGAASRPLRLCTSGGLPCASACSERPRLLRTMLLRRQILPMRDRTIVLFVSMASHAVSKS
jgi:hypothetical protein